MSSQTPPRKGAASGLPTNVPAILATAADVQQMISHGINSDGSLSPEAFRALLKLKGVNLKALTELNGFQDPIFHQVINREFQNETVQNIIAEVLGLSADADRIWGRQAKNSAA